MEPASVLPRDVAEILGRGGIILTGNQRAARTLRLDFDRRRRADGVASWQPPAIFAWDTWTASLWRRMLLTDLPGGIADRLLLNRSQELQLWRSVISTDAQWTSLQSVASLANMAADAWQLLCAYRGQSRLRALGVSGDTRAFQRWAQSFARRCNADLYLSMAELESAITDAISAGSFEPSVNEILLVGFDSRTPAQSALLEALRDTGVRVEESAPHAVAAQLHLATADTPEDELSEAALRVREAIAADPEARIAVIVPDIASERPEIDRIFRQVLAPELQSITADAALAPYEFSLGQPLLQSPMVAVALQLLHWTIDPLPTEEIGHLLLSPYFSVVPAERGDRAEFDAFELRRTRILRPEFDLPSLIGQLERSRRAHRLGAMLKQLRSLHRAAAKLLGTAGSSARQKTFADWADTIRELLDAAGWASSGHDTSIEYQTRLKWEGALDELATLDFEGSRPTFSQALSQMEGIVERTLFAPESHEAPIQIMSPQEAAGSRFDALYFLRCSDLAWPTRPGMNPLLGWRLQRDLLMPGSDAGQDSQRAARVTARLAASAPIVVFSYAKETADAHQRPSPTLAALAPEPLEHSPITDTANGPTVSLEGVEEPGNIPLADPRVRGGSGILKAQAACGFRAFAEKRLWSTALETLEPGMDASERGSIVHGALDHLWQQLHSQAALRELTPQQRSDALRRSIEHSLVKFQDAVASTWDAAYLDLQRDRLLRLLTPWLDLELSRPAFAVKLREQEFEDVAIGPLLLSIRVDRVDRILGDDGAELGEIILDYKTGVSRPSDWQGERPDDPQLPLYAALREPGTVAAVTFASIRPGRELGLHGLAARDGILPKAAKHHFESLDAQIADWHRVLTSLAQDFASGDARVRPKSFPKTCEQCKQRILCRIDPSTLEDEEAADPGAAEAHG
jgi:probable DNA repair protein